MLYSSVQLGFCRMVSCYASKPLMNARHQQVLLDISNSIISISIEATTQLNSMPFRQMRREPSRQKLCIAS